MAESARKLKRRFTTTVEGVVNFTSVVMSKLGVEMRVDC